MKDHCIVVIVLVLPATACTGDVETQVQATSEMEVRSRALTPPAFALPDTWNSDHVRPPVVDRCYLSVASDRLFAGVITHVVGPVIPEDPCDVNAYRFVRPHYELRVMEESGQEMEIVWLDREAKPADLAVGDQIFGGVREVDEEHFLQRFVYVSPNRGQRPVHSDLPDVRTEAVPALEQACATKLSSDSEFRALINGRPDVSCGFHDVVPYRAPGEVDDETTR